MPFIWIYLYTSTPTVHSTSEANINENPLSYNPSLSCSLCKVARRMVSCTMSSSEVDSHPFICRFLRSCWRCFVLVQKSRLYRRGIDAGGSDAWVYRQCPLFYGGKASSLRLVSGTLFGKSHAKTALKPYSARGVQFQSVTPSEVARSSVLSVELALQHKKMWCRFQVQI